MLITDANSGKPNLRANEHLILMTKSLCQGNVSTGLLRSLSKALDCLHHNLLKPN